jgi:MoaA/NifB/PqqE/SkfB family radical SAM enzyme
MNFKWDDLSNKTAIVSTILGFCAVPFKFFATKGYVTRLENRIENLEITVDSNDKHFSEKFDKHKTEVENSINGIREITERQFGVLVKMSDDVGKIKGKMDIE